MTGAIARARWMEPGPGLRGFQGGYRQVGLGGGLGRWDLDGRLDGIWVGGRARRDFGCMDARVGIVSCIGSRIFANEISGGTPK